MIPVHIFKDRAVAIFGLGLSGIASGRALMEGGAQVRAWDDSDDAREAAARAGLPLVDLARDDWSNYAALVLAPGVPLTHPSPHWTVKKARAANVEIVGDTELLFRQREAQRSKARIVAITGTNGKSTTTALTAHVLRTAGVPASLGGNIGTAALDLEPLSDERVYVIEFSSYQIDLTPGLKADAAALLNITPDHLDRHGDIDNYARIKARVFSGLKANGTAVISIDDAYCRTIAGKLGGSSEIKRISTLELVDNGVSVREGVLTEMRQGECGAVLDISGVNSLRGAHNWQNAAAAYALARGLGLTPESVAAGLRTFPGLAHRMEEVGRLGSAVFVNDSKATNADAASHALASFEDVYWIAGGLAKAGGLEGLEPYYSRIRRAYLIGEAAQAFAAALDGKVDHVVCGTLERAVEEAARDAGRSHAREPVVLLSPACASFDQFRSFAVRGDAFRAAVAGLDGIVMRGNEAA